MPKKHNAIFELADRLRELYAEREDAARIVKEIDSEIDTAKCLLFEAMTDADTQSVTRGGVTFYRTVPRCVPATLGVRKKK